MIVIDIMVKLAKGHIYSVIGISLTRKVKKCYVEDYLKTARK